MNGNGSQVSPEAIRGVVEQLTKTIGTLDEEVRRLQQAKNDVDAYYQVNTPQNGSDEQIKAKIDEQIQKIQIQRNEMEERKNFLVGFANDAERCTAARGGAI